MTEFAMVEETADILRASLEGELADVASACRRAGVDCEKAIRLVAVAGEDEATRHPLQKLKASVETQANGTGAGHFERLLLVRAALRFLPALPAAPVGDSVKQSLCKVLRDVAHPTDSEQKKFRVGHSHFGSMCKFATLRRFPAGEYDWDETGIPRSYVRWVDRSDILRLLHFIVRRMGGFRPVFYLHVGLYRNKGSLTQSETDRSYYRVAQAVRLQPQILGCMGAPWFCSPDVVPVSPHLAWISENYLARGALVLRLGPPAPDSGALSRSETRRRLYASGEYVPTRSVVLWPRAALLEWADAHPELADSPEPISSSINMVD